MSNISSEVPKKALTGIRPTGDLTIANYLGALRPVVDMQESFDGPISVFVADIHGITDNEPDIVNSTRLSSARSLIASGVDPEKTTIYLQSQIENETVLLASLLDRHTTPAELARIPALKDKLKGDQEVSNVNLALFRYPVLMAADISIQDATHVPVGEDQMAHIEFTRRIVRRFNQRYGHGEAILVEPQVLARKALRIAALSEADGKMSKSHPSSALLLNDSSDEIAKKIKKAQTAPSGEMPAILESHFVMAELLCVTDEQKAYVENLRISHLEGKPAMKDFKNFLTDRVNEFLIGFRAKFDGISDAEVKSLLLDGGMQAQEQANRVSIRTRKALGFTSFI